MIVRIAPKSRLKLLFIATLVLAIALLFNAMLAIASFEKFFVKRVLAVNTMYVKDLQHNISASLKFGKPLDNFFGMQELLQEAKRNNPDIYDIVVNNTKNQVLYSLTNNFSSFNIDTFFLKQTKEVRFLEKEGFYYLILPIFSSANKQEGSVCIVYSQKVVNNVLTKITTQSLLSLLLISIIGMLVLSGWLNFSIMLNKRKQLSKHFLSFIVLIIIGGAQVVYSIYNTSFFNDNFLQTSKKAAQIQIQLLKDDIEYFFSKGVQISQLYQVDSFLEQMLRANADISNIKILDEQKTIKYQATNKKAQIDSTYIITEPLYTYNLDKYSAKKITGYIYVELDKPFLQAQSQNLIIDSATAILIAVLLMYELIVFLIIVIKKEVRVNLLRGEGDIKIKEEESDTYGLIRPLAFLVLFAVHISLAFMPFYSKALYSPELSISLDFAMSLPISFELFLTALSFIIAGKWNESRGWHKVFLIGLVACISGMFLTAFSTHVYELTLYRGLTGFGYGLVLLSTQNFAILYSSEENKAKSLSNLFAGVYAGSICATATGAMLAERIGYKTVFLLGALILFLAFIYLLVLMRQTFVIPQKVEKTRVFDKAFVKFFFNKDFLVFMLTHAIPGSVILAGFLYYLVPVYLFEQGVSQADIGRFIMVYGLFMVYLSPVCGRFVDKYSQKSMFLLASALLASIGLLAFYFLSGLYATFITILFLAFFMAIGISSKAVYVLSLPASKSYGRSGAIGVYSAFERIGQTLGPILFAFITLQFGVESSMVFLALVFIGLSLVFFFFRHQEESA